MVAAEHNFRYNDYDSDEPANSIDSKRPEKPRRITSMGDLVRESLTVEIAGPSSKKHGLSKALTPLPDDSRFAMFSMGNATPKSKGNSLKAKAEESGKVALPAAKSRTILSIVRGDSNGLESTATSKIGTPARLLAQEATTSFIQFVSLPFSACSSGLEVASTTSPKFSVETDRLRLHKPTLSLQNMDSQEYEEIRQMQRMTSWNTLETEATLTTTDSNATIDSATLPKFDDEGRPLPPAFLEKKKIEMEARAHSTGSRRKRQVKFDYPPISSLRQCPRPDPEDLPNLYFTEEELSQIEDDRESTYTADDVEVVCVSTSSSSDNALSSPTSQLSAASVRKSDFNNFAHLRNKGSRPTLDGRRSGRPATPLPRRNKTGQVDAPSGDDSQSRHRKRHIKSVQIYLRERSRERTPRS